MGWGGDYPDFYEPYSTGPPTSRFTQDGLRGSKSSLCILKPNKVIQTSHFCSQLFVLRLKWSSPQKKRKNKDSGPSRKSGEGKHVCIDSGVCHCTTAGSERSPLSLLGWERRGVGWHCLAPILGTYVLAKCNFYVGK